MSKIKLKELEVHTVGPLPSLKTSAPDFTVTKNDFTDLTLDDLKGKNVVLNIFPSIDTAVCAASVREFNQKASSMKNTTVLCISADLPFALSRFCGAENITDVISASIFRHPEFGEIYGVKMTDGPLKGLLSRAIVVINDSGHVIYTEQVDNIAHEPDYQKVLDVLPT
jgi:thiol peroxidase